MECNSYYFVDCNSSGYKPKTTAQVPIFIACLKNISDSSLLIDIETMISMFMAGP